LQLYLFHDIIMYSSNFMVTLSSTRPFQVWFVMHSPGLAMMRPPIKFEISIFTGYEDMKGDTRRRNWGVWG